MADAKLIRMGMPTPRFAGSSWVAHPLNAATDTVEWFFQARGTPTITRLGFKVGSIVGTTPVYRVSLQGVTLTGHVIPDGTVKGGGSPASATFDPSTLGWANNTYHWVTLDNAYTPASEGEHLAYVIDYSSGTIDGSNYASIAYADSSGGFNEHQSPVLVTNDAGVRTWGLYTPTLAYGSAGTAYGTPYVGTTGVSASNTNERGIRWSLPAGWGASYKVAGVRVVGSWSGALNKTLTVNLYDGGGAADTTVIQTGSFNSSLYYSASNNYASTVWFNSTDLETLLFGNYYRIGLSVSDASNWAVSAIDVDAAADWEGWPGGQLFGYTYRAGGNWTDLATKRLCIELLISDWTEPAGGGIIRPAGLGGGILG